MGQTCGTCSQKPDAPEIESKPETEKASENMVASRMRSSVRNSQRMIIPSTNTTHPLK